VTASAPIASLVIGSYNRRRYLESAIASARPEFNDGPYEIIVVDGGSTDGTLQWLLKQKDVVTIVQHNRGTWRGKPIERRSWGHFMNLGFRAATGKYVCMISDDSLVVPGAIRNGIRQFEEVAGSGVGAIAFYWRNWPDQIDYWVGVTFGNNLFVNHGMYLRTALERVGYIDDETYFFYHADGDLALRMLEAGYSTIEAADSFIEHYSHANQAVRASNAALQPDDWASYRQRWASLGVPDQDWRRRSHDDATRTAERHWKRRRLWPRGQR
jgi:glycosyltransferase involved in cell wall biosynthesis